MTYLGNTGAGFVNTSLVTYTIYNANGGVSTGTLANLTFTTGATLRTEFSNGSIFFNKSKILNLEAVQIFPDTEIDNPAGVTYTLTNQTAYYAQTNVATFSGRSYYLFNDPTVTDLSLANGVIHNFVLGNEPVLPSRSNQFAIRYANGAIPNTAVVGQYYSNSSLYFILTAANNDFVAMTVEPEVLNSTYGKYSINNDYTNENTNYGNAWAKGIESKVTLANNQFAEDIVVYLTAFRPPTTDLKVFARIHNSNDPESFDDKDWTMLQMTDGLGVYSNPADQTDMKEYTYHFQQSPNSVFVGVVSAANGNATITGTNTHFTSSLVVNQLVKLYQPLFPNDDYIVGVVNSISSDTSLTLVNPIANSGVAGSGLYLDLITYPLQAFNNETNDNVVRYYSTSQVEYDTFDTYAIKIVFLSPSDYTVPKVDDCRAVAVSA